MHGNTKIKNPNSILFLHGFIRLFLQFFKNIVVCRRSPFLFKVSGPLRYAFKNSLFILMSFGTLSRYFFPPWRKRTLWAMTSFSRLRNHTQSKRRHPVEFIWPSDQPDAETSAWQHTTLTTQRHPCPGGIPTHNPSKRATTDQSLWYARLCINHTRAPIKIK